MPQGQVKSRCDSDSGRTADAEKERLVADDANEREGEEAQGRPRAVILFPVSVGKHGNHLLVELPFRPCFPTLTGNRMTNAKRWTLRGCGIVVAVASSASASFAYSVSVFLFPFQCLNRRSFFADEADVVDYAGLRRTRTAAPASTTTATRLKMA